MALPDVRIDTCAAAAQTASDLSKLFDSVGFTAQQRAAIGHGRAVAEVLPWGDASEIYVFSAVPVDGSPAAYLKLARNIGRLANGPGYLGVGELAANISAPPLEPDDIKALKPCREGNCDVQLPTESLLQNAVVGRTRSTLERALASMKAEIEHAP